MTLLLLVSFAAADTGRSDGDSDGDTFSDSVFMYQITSVANKEARIFYTVGAITDSNIPGTALNGANGYKIVEIYNSALMNKALPKSIIIPDSVRVIGDETFKSCTGVESVTINGNVTIGNSAFSNIESLIKVELKGSANLVASTFNSCKNLSDFTMEKVTAIGNSAFSDTALTQANIPEGVNEIGNYAFNGVKTLTSVSIPSTVTSIGDYVFLRTSIESAILPNSLTYIGNHAFGFTKLKEVNIPAGVKKINDYAFYQCSSLTKVVLNGNVSVGENTFSDCTVLTDINTSLITEYGQSAFAKSGLTSVTISSSVKSLNNTFSGAKLTDVTIEDYSNITTFFYPFNNCKITDFTIKGVKANGNVYKKIDWSFGNNDANCTKHITVVSPSGGIVDLTGLSSAPGANADRTLTVQGPGKVNISVAGGKTFNASESKNTPISYERLGSTKYWARHIAVINLPSVTSSFTYDGSAKSPLSAAAGYSVDGTISAVDSGTYGFRIVLTDKAYTKWSDGTTADQSFTWSILKANYDVSSAKWVGGSFIYDGTVKSVFITGLPAGLIPVYTDNSASKAGTYVANATFNVDGNHNPVDSMSHTWSVGKASYDISLVKWSADSFVFDGTVKRVTLTGLPEGLYVISYSDNEKTDVGKYYADAVLGTGPNYYLPVLAACEWEITKHTQTTEENGKLFTIEEILYDTPAVFGGLALQDPTYSEHNVTLHFFRDRECTVPVEDIEYEEPGEYWVYATVTGLTNYGDLTSEAVAYEVPVGIYGMDDREGSLWWLAAVVAFTIFVLLYRRRKEEEEENS